MEVVFYKGNINLFHQKFMKQGLFFIKEIDYHNEKYNSVIYVT